MKILKLNSLANASLGTREMGKIVGGKHCCCACAGSSGIIANNNANAAGGLKSPECQEAFESAEEESED
jgi:natural product precursor